MYTFIPIDSYHSQIAKAFFSVDYGKNIHSKDQLGEKAFLLK